MPRAAAAKVKEKLKQTIEPERPIKNTDYLSTGSTLLNLACSDRRNGGLVKGRYFFLVGDSASGKTWFTLTFFAEAALNEEFKDYDLVYNNVEDGALMDLRRYFGQKMAERLEMTSSNTIEEFYDDMDDRFGAGKPFIYVLDSMDALSSEDEEEKFQKQKSARKAGREASGSYGDGKAKKNSAGIRRVLAKLKETGSILIIISQTRDNIGFGSQFNPKTRAGGRALRFYAGLELWTSVKQKIKAMVKGKQRSIGIVCEVQVKKNRLTGKERRVEIPIYHSVGVDDIGGCIRWLIEEGHWTGNKERTKVTAPEFGFNGSVEKLVSQIEEQKQERKLRRLVMEVWEEIEAGCVVERKSRYA